MEDSRWTRLGGHVRVSCPCEWIDIYTYGYRYRYRYVPPLLPTTHYPLVVSMPRDPFPFAQMLGTFRFLSSRAIWGGELKLLQKIKKKKIVQKTSYKNVQ